MVGGGVARPDPAALHRACAGGARNSYACNAPRWPLIPPKVPEPRRRQFRISDRVADIAMPKVVLNGSRVVAIARELVSRTMSQHVRVNLKGQSRLLTRALDQPIEAIGREWCSSLIDE